MRSAELDSQWSTLTDSGLSAYRRSDLIGAEKLLSKALLKSHEFQAGDVRRLKSMNNLACVFVAQKRYSEAIAVFESVVKISETVAAPNESILALSQSVRLYKALGKVKLAQAAQAKLVKLTKTIRMPAPQAASSAWK